MRCVSMTLNGYELVKDSGISKLHVDFTQDVQLIIGSNGSGKTSVGKRLSPMPAVKNLFADGGSRINVYEKDGIYYRLESDYSRPSSPHLFFEGDDEENLNIGRTTSTQIELIEQKLGVTPIVDDLMMNRYNFPKTTVSERKEFLMGINPAQIGFVLDHIKKIQSKIKACKNNLARLNSRKIVLEQDLMDEDVVASLHEERITINQILGDIQQYLMTIEVGTKTLGRLDPFSDLTWSTPTILLTDLKRHRRQLHRFSHIERDDARRGEIKQHLLVQKEVAAQRRTTLEEELLVLTDKLNDLQVRYSDLNVKNGVESIDLTIKQLEHSAEKLKTQRPAFEMSKADLEQRYGSLEELVNRLLVFTGRTVPLVSSTKLRQRDRLLSSAQYRVSALQQRIGDLKTQLQQVVSKHTLSMSDIPDEPCAKRKCPLYRHFTEEYQYHENKRQSLARQIEYTERRIRRYQFYIGIAIQRRDDLQPYVDQIRWLQQEARTNPVLHSILRQINILGTLSTNPNRIHSLVKEAYDQMERWCRYKEVLSDLEDAYVIKRQQVDDSDTDTVKLVMDIERTRKDIDRNMETSVDLSATYRSVVKRIAEIDAFEAIKTDVVRIQRVYQDCTTRFSTMHESERLSKLKELITEERNRKFTRLSEIDQILRKHEDVSSRLQEEVISQIAVIEKELSDQQHIEVALIKIPKENMVKFINNLFRQANLLIGIVWTTIPLKLELLKMEDPLTYQFMVSGDHGSLREISKCSEGQNEIISLCFNLALRMVLGHTNYPLCLDETGRTFDETHKENLITLLKRILDDKVISQLFYISHHASTHEAFGNSETLVIREDNILLPEVYNQHASIL